MLKTFNSGIGMILAVAADRAEAIAALLAAQAKPFPDWPCHPGRRRALQRPPALSASRS